LGAEAGLKGVILGKADWKNWVELSHNRRYGKTYWLYCHQFMFRI